MSSLKSWPSTARHILLDAAQFFYRQMNEPFAVYDVHMDEAIEYANREIDRRQSEIYDEASDKWVSQWEDGQLDPVMKKAIAETYGKLRKAERGIRSHARIKKTGVHGKRTSRQLAAEIAQSLAARNTPKAGRP